MNKTVDAYLCICINICTYTYIYVFFVASIQKRLCLPEQESQTTRLHKRPKTNNTLTVEKGGGHTRKTPPPALSSRRVPRPAPSHHA